MRKGRGWESGKERIGVVFQAQGCDQKGSLFRESVLCLDACEEPSPDGLGEETPSSAR